MAWSLYGACESLSVLFQEERQSSVVKRTQGQSQMACVSNLSLSYSVPFCHLCLPRMGETDLRFPSPTTLIEYIEGAVISINENLTGTEI